MKHLIRQHLRRSVLVSLKSGEGFRGVLYAADSECVVLRNAQLVDATGTDRTPAPVDGELLVLRPDIAYLQFLSTS